MIRALERDIEKLEERLKEPIEEVDPAPHQREVVRLSFSLICTNLTLVEPDWAQEAIWGIKSTARQTGTGSGAPDH